MCVALCNLTEVAPWQQFRNYFLIIFQFIVDVWLEKWSQVSVGGFYLAVMQWKLHEELLIKLLAIITFTYRVLVFSSGSDSLQVPGKKSQKKTF